jgi:hypothetical protein
VPAYVLKETREGFLLSGGALDSPLLYPAPDGVEYARRMVGFLSQVSGSELTIYDLAENIIEVKTFREGVSPAEKSMVTMLRDGTTGES